MPASLGPSFVEINYHSSFGFHTMTLPTLEYDQVNDEFQTWAAGVVDSVTMIEAFVDTLLPFFPTTVVFDNYTIYDLPTDPGPALPRKSAILTAKAGAVAAPGWTKAVQFTVTIRTATFGILKIVLLDIDSGNSFERQAAVTTPSDFTDMMAELTADTNAWSGRDNGQPNVFLQCSRTLNEKLRKSYRMT